MSSLFYDGGPAASGQKVLLATPAYDSPDASYTYSIARSREALTAAGIQSAYYLLSGNCHIDDARNTIVRDFLASDCTDLVFLDADVSWEPEHLVALCRFDKDIVGGVYPYRREGGGKEHMPVRMMKGAFYPDAEGLLEVEGLPTGFLRIRRCVLESMAKEARHFSKGDGDAPLPLLFERDIFEGGRRGGDIHFCMKWREMGGQLFAAANLRLGHCGKSVIRDSLAASLRRQTMETLLHLAKMVREDRDTLETYAEAFHAMNNPWGATADLLQLAATLARKATGPILEMGCGLSTIVMAAATDQKVWCVEHEPEYAARIEAMAARAGVGNIMLVTCGLKDGWYDLEDEELPERFAVALVDGPPRLYGDRMRFFDVFGERCTAILADDADDPGYAGKLTAWAAAHNRDVRIDQRAAVILPQAAG